MRTEPARAACTALCLVLIGCSLPQRTQPPRTPRAARDVRRAPKVEAARVRGTELSPAPRARKRKAAPAQESARRSSGCGKPHESSGSFESHVLQAGGRERKYHLLVPAGYDARRAYPLTFRFHGSGGDGLSGGLAIEQQTDDGAIVVSPDGLERGWSSAHHEADLALFDALLARLAATHCIDLARVYAYGFSMGAQLSELLACKRGHALRAIAAIAGWSDEPAEARCTGTVAAWLAHDRDDEAVPLAKGQHARDRLLRQNECSQASEEAGAGCVRYLGCAAGEPVVWCETRGLGHDIRGAEAPAKVWHFFSSLPAR